jgi:hypothetical protein
MTDPPLLDDPGHIANRPRCEAGDDYVLPTGTDLGPCTENCPKHGKGAQQ